MPPSDLPPEEIFLRSLDLIKRIVDYACRRSRLRPADKDEFLSRVHVKVMDDDYAVIRRFEGRDNAKLDTYLTTVINRSLLDFLDHLWGKWRESSEAHRLGGVAERLEQLINRDGYTFDEACEILRTNEKVELSVAQLADLGAKLPPRARREFVGEGLLRFKPDCGLPPDQQLEEKELEGIRRRVYMALHRTLDTLSSDDRLFVKMLGKFSIADIARVWKVDQKPLYRRRDKLLKSLKKEMERQGVRREEVNAILGCLKADDVTKPKKQG